MATNFIDRSQVEWLDKRPIEAARSLVFLWQLRWCASLSKKISSDQGWHEFSYFEALRFILQFGVHARFGDDATNAAVKETYENRSVRNSIDLPYEDQGFRTVFEAAAITSADVYGQAEYKPGKPTSPAAVLEHLEMLSAPIILGTREDKTVSNKLLSSLESKDPLQYMAVPIWPADISVAFNECLIGLLDGLEKHRFFGSFWRDWYEGFLSGRPMNWRLQRRVALIDPEMWNAGPEAVAQRIEEIKADLLAENAPLAETVELNAETGKFRVVPIPVQNPALLGAMIARTKDAIEDALHGPNGLREDSHEVRKLNRTHTRYANDPQRVEMDYTSVAVSLRRQIRETGELAESEDNLALLEAVEEGALAIRAQHPEVAENRNIIAAQKLRELAPENIELLEDALPLLEEISEGAMREDFAKDIPKLINDATLPLPTGAPPLPGADEATRIFSRVAKMSKLYRAMYEQGADIFDSKQFKTVRLGLTVGGALTALITFGIRLFGPL